MNWFAKPAATTNKTMRYFLWSAVFCLIVAVSVVDEAATSVRGQTSYAQVRALHRSLELTGSVIGEEYCRNTAMQRFQLGLKLKLSLKNTSAATIIVSRFANPINRVVLSKSLKKAKSGDYVYDEISTLMSLPWPEQNDAQQLSPTVEFVTLKPGESFDYKYPQSIDITLSDANDLSVRVSPGRYLLKVKIQTSLWDTEKIKALEQRWAQYGSLWYWDITSQPLAISIEKPSSTTTTCKSP